MGLKQMEVTEVSIGENMFYIKPFPAFKAANISGDIVSAIAPLLGSIMPMVTSNNEVTDDDAIHLIGNAFSSLNGDQVEKLLKKLLVDNKNVSIEGDLTNNKPKIMDMDLANEAFCGDVWDMYMLCWEVLKLNYSGFFEKLKGTQFGSQLGNMVASQN